MQQHIITLLQNAVAAHNTFQDDEDCHVELREGYVVNKETNVATKVVLYGFREDIDTVLYEAKAAANDEAVNAVLDNFKVKEVEFWEIVYYE